MYPKTLNNLNNAEIQNISQILQMVELLKKNYTVNTHKKSIEKKKLKKCRKLKIVSILGMCFFVDV